jgi:hypothetical protein
MFHKTDLSDFSEHPFLTQLTLQHKVTFADATGNIWIDPLLEPIEPDDIIKIMLATDNHVGYLARDPVHGQDSINSFKEILELAVKYNVCLYSFSPAPPLS